MQYPAVRDVEFSTEVLEFIDGSEQRYRNFSSPLMRWVVRLDQLDDDEMAHMEDFYVAEQGPFGTFSFTDPWDGTEYAECSFENPDVLAEYMEYHNGRIRLVVRQVR